MGFNYLYDRAGNVPAEGPTHESGSGSTAIAGVDYFNYDSAYRRTRESRGIYGTLSISNNTTPNPNVTGTAAGQDQRDSRRQGAEGDQLLDGVTNWREVEEDNGSSSVSRSVNNVNEYTDVDSVGRAHDANGNLVWDGTHLFYDDGLNRLVRVERDDGSTRGDIAWYGWDTKGRRIRKFVNDVNQTGNTGLKEERVFFYVGQTVIEEEDILNSTSDRQWIVGALGDRFREYQADEVSVEKLDGSVVARVDENRDVIAAYDYRSQGLVRVWDPGSDGDYFTSDDGAQVAVDVTHATTHAIYLSQDRRFDLETGKYLGGAGTRLYDPENGRKLQPSADMWQSSPWGLRYNSLAVIFDTKSKAARLYKDQAIACLQKICPCLAVNAASLPNGTLITMRQRPRTFGECECYCRHRVGCNLLLDLYGPGSLTVIRVGKFQGGTRRSFPATNPIGKKHALVDLPYSGLKVTMLASKASLCRILAHEMVHAHQFVSGTSFPAGPILLDPSETDAVRGANAIGREVGWEGKVRRGSQYVPNPFGASTLDVSDRFGCSWLFQPKQTRGDCTQCFPIPRPIY